MYRQNLDPLNLNHRIEQRIDLAAHDFPPQPLHFSLIFTQLVLQLLYASAYVFPICLQETFKLSDELILLLPVGKQFLPCKSFYAPRPGSYPAFADYLKKPYLAGAVNMSASAKLFAKIPNFHDSDFLSILFSKEGDRSLRPS